MSSYFRSWLVLAILFCSASGQLSFAEDKSLVVGVEDTSYYPHYDSVDGQWSGFGAELLHRFAESAGYKLEFRPMPVERLFRSFVLGEVDFKYPSSPVWKADRKSDLNISYSDPVVGYTDGASVLPERVGAKLSSIKTLGIIRGFTAVSWADHIASGKVRLVPADNFSSLILQALRGRVDAIYANTAVVNYQIAQLQSQSGDSHQLVFDTGLPNDRNFYRLATLKHPAVIEQFDQWMRKNSVLIAKMKVEYFGTTNP